MTPMLFDIPRLIGHDHLSTGPSSGDIFGNLEVQPAFKYP